MSPNSFWSPDRYDIFVAMQVKNQIPPKSTTAHALSLLILVVFLFAVTIWGAFIAGTCLIEPDCCFLIATGRWIIQHGQIPQTDPFSFTYSLFSNGQPIVIYQWLSEIVFYGVMSAGGAVGLECFIVALLSVSYAILPLRMFEIAGIRILPALALVSLVLLACIGRPSSRPEAFSYLFLACWLERIVFIRNSAGHKGTLDWSSVIVLVTSMLVWCNMHTGFITGIILLAVVAVITTVDRHILHIQCASPLIFFVSLPLCALATFFNPYGVRLWAYVYHLCTMPTNATILELRHMSFADMRTGITVPFTIFFLVSLFILVQSFLRGTVRKHGILGPALMLIGFALPFVAMRLTGFSVLLMASSIALLNEKRLTPVDNRTVLLNLINMHLSNLCSPFSPKLTLSVVIFAATGAVLLGAFTLTSTVPMSTKAFTPPFKAIKFLSQISYEGNMFNDPHFGDVMMWYLQPCPKLFIDSRYDIYPHSLVTEYWQIARAQPGFDKWLKHYNIRWIILPPSLLLNQKLAQDPQWNKVYAGNDAIIFHRKSCVFGKI